jgi:hypothetical protein
MTHYGATKMVGSTTRPVERSRTVFLDNSTIHVDTPGRHFTVVGFTETVTFYPADGTTRYLVNVWGPDERGHRNTVTYTQASDLPDGVTRYRLGASALLLLGADATVTFDAVCEPVESQPERTARYHREAREKAVRDALTNLRADIQHRRERASGQGAAARALALEDCLYDIDVAIARVGGA